MTVTVKELIPRKQAENTQTTQYTANSVTTIIDKFTATNTSLANVKLSVNLVTVSDTPGNENLVLKERVITPGETYFCPELIGQVISNGGFISTLADAATSITISSGGREIT